MFNATEYLKRALRKVITEEFLSADKLVTKETIETRVFEKVARLMGKKICEISMNDYLYVHPEVSAFLSRHVPPDHPAFNDDEKKDRLLASRIYSGDRHDAQTLYEFCHLLENKIASIGSSERNLLHRVFAVDGFRGLSLVDYVSNLKYPLSKSSSSEEEDRSRAIERHVSGVRLLYEMFDNMSVETVAIAIRNAVDYVESVDPKLQEITEVYLSHVLEKFDDIKNFIDLLKNSIEEKVLIE